MKKNTYCLLIAVLMSSVIYAQKTSLTVDCQTPGWLASYLDPSIAPNATDLTISGSLNEADFKVIGNMMKNYQLKGKLDLSEVQIVGEQESFFSGDMFGVTDCRLSYLSLPKSLTNMERTLSFGEVDTLEVGGEALPDFYIISHLQTKYSNGYCNPSSITLKHLIVRDGTKKMGSTNGRSRFNATDRNNSLISIKLPESIIHIEGLNRFENLTYINTPQNVEYLGGLSGTKVFHDVETYYVPSKVKYFNSAWINDGYLGEGGTVNRLYLPECLTTFYLSNINYKATISIHCKSPIAPNIENTSSMSLQDCVVYVPAGFEEVYKTAATWKNATILGEVYAEDITITAPTLYKGDNCVIKGSILPSNTTFKNLIWESDNEEILAIDNEGKALALECGTVKITAYSSDKGCKSTMDVTVFEHTAGITFDKEELELKVGAKTQISAKTLPLNLSDNRVTYASSDPNVATVDDEGNVEAKNKGNCTIIATSVDGGYIAECKVIVTQPVGTVELNKHNISLNVGEVKQLGATVLPTNADNKSLVWSSSNSEVVTVDENGEIEALQAGNAYIKVVSVDNPSALDSCMVSVVQPTTGITLSHVNYTFNAIGESVQLTATVSPENATNKNVKWASSNESICIVNNGLVIGVGEGTAVIIATTEDGGHMATCVITVKNKEYLLTYVLDGKVYYTESLAEGEVITPLEEPTKEGYTFSGWSEIPGTMPADNVTITGTFTVNQYNVTFMIDGAEFATVAVNYGESITIPEVSAREGYTFAWTDEIPETMPAKDIVINGAYSIIDDISNVVVKGEIHHIYTLDGQRTSRLHQGLNIVRMKDGSIRKLFHK